MGSADHPPQDKPRLIRPCEDESAGREKREGEKGTASNPGGPIPAAPGMTNTPNALGVRSELGLASGGCTGGVDAPLDGTEIDG